MKSKQWIARGLLAASAVTCGMARAEPIASSPISSETVTLVRAVESAWQRAVVAREINGEREQAQANRMAASSLWAAPPVIELGHRNDRWQSNEGRRETELGLAWPLWLPGQRAARAGMADSELAFADLNVRASKLRIAGDVREAAWRLLAHQADAAQAEAARLSLKSLAEDVKRRVHAGDLARTDDMAASAELLGAQAVSLEAEQRLSAAQASWTVLTGQAGVPDAAEPTIASTPQGGHPELLLAAQSVDRARRRVELVRTSGREPPELTLRYRQDIPGRSEPTQNSIGLALRLPLGTADRNEPLRIAALNELNVAQVHEQRLIERHAIDLSSARSAFDAAERQLAAEQARAALMRERARLIEKSFHAGETALPEVLRAMSAAHQAEAVHARQQINLGLARARLQQTLGLLP